MATLNVNVGVLGHVDSGKTSLGVFRAVSCWLVERELCAACTARRRPTAAHSACPLRCPLPVAALSTTLSTAALDKNPQSRERGITLDLGFSSFTVSS